MPFLHNLAIKIWNRQGVLGRLAWLGCLPLSLGFRGGVRVRNFLYTMNLLPRTQLAVAVISVGNLTVGGTGKTPFVLWLARKLQSGGRRVAIVSRGYRGRESGVTIVGANGRVHAGPQDVGDEAVMLARVFSGVVVAGRDRVTAARLAVQAHNVDVVLLDDGFQYRRLARRLEVLLINARPRVSGGSTLPAGPFREPRSSARRADVVILTKAGNPQMQDAAQAVALHGHGKPCFFADLCPTALVYSAPDAWRERPVSFLVHKRVLTVSGVADPSLFYHFVTDAGADIAEVMEFPDHHVYRQSDWRAITAASRKYDLVVTTEKDLVKLERFPFATDKLVALRVDMDIDEAGALLHFVEERLQAAPA